MGSPNKFGWLTKENVTSPQKATETRFEIPLRQKCLALSPRYSLGESSTPLRMTC